MRSIKVPIEQKRMSMLSGGGKAKTGPRAQAALTDESDARRHRRFRLCARYDAARRRRVWRDLTGLGRYARRGLDGCSLCSGRKTHYPERACGASLSRIRNDKRARFAESESPPISSSPDAGFLALTAPRASSQPSGPDTAIYRQKFQSEDIELHPECHHSFFVRNWSSCSCMALC
jgi:hypothetical protein